MVVDESRDIVEFWGYVFLFVGWLFFLAHGGNLIEGLIGGLWMKPRVCENGRCDNFLDNEAVGLLCKTCGKAAVLANRRRELQRMEALGLWRLECERLSVRDLLDETLRLAESGYDSGAEYKEDKLEIAKLVLARRIDDLS